MGSLAAVDWEGVTESLKARDRNAILSILFNADILPKVYKPAVVLAINTMPAEQVDYICDQAIEAVAFFKAGDIEGLKSMLTGLGFPDTIIAKVFENASTLHNS